MAKDVAHRVLLCVLAADLGALVYLNALHHPFVYDDLVVIVGNASLRDPLNVRALLAHTVFRPVTNASLALDHALWGLRPLGFHLTGVLLHAANVVLLFGLARRAVADWQARDPARAARCHADAVAFAAAALFAVHPLMTEAVGYASARADVLSATFFLAGLLLLRGALARGGAGRLALGALLALLGAAAKEVVVVLPVVLLTWDRLLLGGDPVAWRRRLLRAHAPLLGALAALGAARAAAFVWIEDPAPALSLWAYVQTQPVVVWRYLALLLLPRSQSIVHDVPVPGSVGDPWAVVAAPALVTLGALVVVTRRYQPLVALGAAWFFLALAPSSLVPLFEPMVERRAYLAAGGAFLAAGAGFGWMWGRRALLGARLRWIPPAALAVVLAALALTTVARNRVWADPVTLWQDAAQKAPGAWTAHWGLGNALREAGRCPEAIPVYERALALAPRPWISSNLGMCLAAERRLPEAARAWEAALVLDPRYAPAHHNLGLLALRAGDRERAHRHFLQAITPYARDAAWRRDLVALYESNFDDPAKMFELCREIYRVASDTTGVKDCLARYEPRAGRPSSPR